jgi:hypothetical protein
MIATGQFTITDFNDINISTTEPISPVLDMLWLDTSATPYTLKSWNGTEWVASRALSLAELDAIQDAKLNTRITTFYQPTVPTSTAVGDFWVDTSNNNHLYRAECIGADEIADGEWVSVRDDSAVEELEEFVDSVYTPGIANLQEQIDGKIDTWYQPHEPGPWTGKERIDHHGDMWYQTGTGILRRYNSSWNVWEIVESQTAADAYAKAAKADDTADNKRRVFTAQPYPPYDVGDLWTQGPTGELMRCKTAKASTPAIFVQEGLIIPGTTAVFDQADWELASKYTDDSTANSKNTTFSACPSDGKYKKNDIMIPSEGFVSGAKTFNAGEIYQALADGDGIVFNPVHWAEASLISAWKKTGTTTIDGGQIAADSVNATQLNGDTAMVNFLNALNITAKYISASGITAGTLTLTANLNIESSDGNLEINGTQLKYTHADGTESRLGASGLRLYENGLLLPYISTVDAGMIDKFNEKEGYWNYIVGNGYKKYFYLKRRGIRWLNQADNVKMLVTQGEELEWYDPSQYRHTGIKGMKYAVGDITNVAPSVTIRTNYVGSYYSTNTMVYLDSNASDIDGFYAQEYITINGETRKIVQYIANSHRAFVDEAFSSPPQYNDTYSIHSGPGGVNIEVESWYLAPWYSGISGGEYYYALTFGYMLILNN